MIRTMAPAARVPRVRRVFDALIFAALVVLLAIVLFVAAGIVGTPWFRLVSIEGGSMAPAISRGDLIVVAPAPSTVEPGMILVMTVAGEVVTHRVVAVNADGTFATRGDANPVNDAFGSTVVVNGLYVGTIPLLGLVLRVGDVSEASFADRTGAATNITVGPWPSPVVPPTPVPADPASATAAPPEPTATPVDDTPEPTLDPTGTPGDSPLPDPTSTPAPSP